MAKSVLFKTGALRALRAVRPSNQLAILRYHAICGPEGYAYASPGICISPRAFEQHVQYLAANYRVLPLPEAVRALRERKTLPANAVAITFDDGYADNLEAARTLARHGIAATFYITAGCMHGDQPFWPSELRYLLHAVREAAIELELPTGSVLVDLATAAARQAAIGRITKLLKAYPIPVRERLRDQLRRYAGDMSMPRVMLTWDEIREMHGLGMTIGSHTMTHPNLPNAGLAAAREELLGARARIAAETSSKGTMFSYPNGGANRYLTPELKEIVREVGHEAATTSRNAFASATSDLFALERIQVEEPLCDLVFALEVERFAFIPVARPGE